MTGWLALPEERWLSTAGGKRRRNRLRWSVYLKRVLSEQQNHRCCHCGFRMVDDVPQFHPRYPTFEHVRPLSRLGADHPENLVIACYACNLARNRVPDDLADHGVYFYEINCLQVSLLTLPCVAEPF